MIKRNMLFTFLQKQKNIKKQKQLIHTMIMALSIPKEQKELYINALEVLSVDESQKLYVNLANYIEKIELKEIDEIRKQGFGNIEGMRKKEAEEKLKEMNSFSFLLHNL